MWYVIVVIVCCYSVLLIIVVIVIRLNLSNLRDVSVTITHIWFIEGEDGICNVDVVIDHHQFIIETNVNFTCGVGCFNQICSSELLKVVLPVQFHHHVRHTTIRQLKVFHNPSIYNA